MITTLVAILAIIGFISLVIAFYEESLLFDAVSLLCWIIILGGSLGLETYWINSTVNITTTVHQEPAFSVFAMGLIFISVVLIVVHLSDYQRNKRFRI